MYVKPIITDVVLISVEPRVIQAVIDGKNVSIPDDPDNTHWQLISQWVADGNTIEDNS